MSFARVVALAGLVLVSSCAGDATAPPVTIPVAGHWIGAVSADVLEITLATTGDQVSGSGTLASVDASAAVTVTGSTKSDSTVTLSITGGPKPLAFGGRLVGDQLLGVAAGGTLTIPAVVQLRRVP